ncbi:type II toxin-antitoxin system mRNA interferase toxin, RelE/StbE family [Candidatus Peregrinibacteria bacterium]|nr:type II toxin-antitoxin system mRNA interferase toxin, RelE/StbE family [Candidatus Peregrinibacteria bacterium]
MKINIEASPYFQRRFLKLRKKRPQIGTLLKNALRLLKQSEFFPESLKIHPLHGKLKDYYAFSLTYDLRVVFQKKSNFIILVNIGSHEEVY